MKIACPEEVAFRMNFMTAPNCGGLARALGTSAYGQYLAGVADEEAA